eukprot:1161864-Pelagomonas_calceolata.AAC.24
MSIIQLVSTFSCRFLAASKRLMADSFSFSACFCRLLTRWLRVPACLKDGWILLAHFAGALAAWENASFVVLTDETQGLPGQEGSLCSVAGVWEGVCIPAPSAPYSTCFVQT